MVPKKFPFFESDVKLNFHLATTSKKSKIGKLQLAEMSKIKSPKKQQKI